MLAVGDRNKIVTKTRALKSSPVGSNSSSALSIEPGPRASVSP